MAGTPPGPSPGPQPAQPLAPSDYLHATTGVLVAATTVTGLGGLVGEKVLVIFAIAIAATGWLATFLASKGH